MSTPELDVAFMRAAGIDDDEIIRLAGLRRRVAEGECSEVTAEHKRLLFGKFLIDTKRLTDDVRGAA